MSRIHWIGTGLSSGPGLRRLIKSNRNVSVWNRTLDRAQALVGDLTDNIMRFSPEAVRSALAPGDIVVSMLPADWHVPLAKLCLETNAHFASSSYLSPEMLELDASAKGKGLVFVNESGLDPGIDHWMAHWLIDDYRASDAYDRENEIRFRSYCGGVPKGPNDIFYKFSWSPLGVLKALRSPSKSISEGRVLRTERPWQALSEYEAPLPNPEIFEVYPNRDSLPFISQYGMDNDWNIKEFVRGTLRLKGWAGAWSGIFAAIESFQDDERRLAELAEKLWTEECLRRGRPRPRNSPGFIKCDPWRSHSIRKDLGTRRLGTDGGSAMARLVSIPLSMVVESVLAGEFPPRRGSSSFQSRTRGEMVERGRQLGPVLRGQRRAYRIGTGIILD